MLEYGRNHCFWQSFRGPEEYTLTTDDGIEYKLSAILPWEAVPADFDSGRFAVRLGERVTISGVIDGDTIWRAVLVEETPQ